MPELSLKAQVQHLRKQISLCRACPIYDEAMCKPTPSSGNPSPIMLVGRNPGITERDERKPFVGRTKVDMDAMIHALGYNRDSIYITNVLKCYTSFPKPDRPPSESEIKFCAGLYLDKEIELLQPQLIVTLGKDAFVYLMDGLVPTCTGYTGRVMYNPKRPTLTIFPLFHPAMLLRSPLQYKDKMEQDFGQLFLYCKEKGLLGPGLQDEDTSHNGEGTPSEGANSPF